MSIGKERNTGYFDTKTGGEYVDGNTAVFGKLTFSPNRKSFGSVSFNYVDSDNSTPTNEPIIEGQLLHDFDPRFDRLTNFNIPGPNYHQGESRFTFNYTWQPTPSARIVEVFGYRDVQQQFIEDGDFIGSPFDLVAHTVMMYPFDQDLNENIFYQELRGRVDAEDRQRQELARRRRVVRAHGRHGVQRLHLHGRGQRWLPDQLPQPGDPAGASGSTTRSRCGRITSASRACSRST